MNSKIEKLSYEELIKALNCCAHTIETNMCGECPAAKYEAGKCDDLVKLQAAEMLQAFKTENEKMKNTKFSCDLSITQIKSEAIKAFSENLKAKKHSQPMSQAEYFGLTKAKSVVDVDDIDETYKAMVGEQV